MNYLPKQLYRCNKVKELHKVRAEKGGFVLAQFRYFVICSMVGAKVHTFSDAKNV